MFINLVKNASADVFLIIFLITLISFLVVRKFFSIKPIRLFYGLSGLTVGVIIGSLISLPFMFFPPSWNFWLPFIINTLISLSFLELFLLKGESIFLTLKTILKRFLRL